MTLDDSLPEKAQPTSLIEIPEAQNNQYATSHTEQREEVVV
jgi:hypothetical protein